MTVQPSDNFLVNVGGLSYRCTAEELPDKLTASMTMLLNRDGKSYAISGDKVLDLAFDDTDLFLVNRESLSYSATGAQVKEIVDTGPRNTDVVGSIAYWAASPTTLPADWFVCNGQTIPADNHPELAALIGSTGGLITVPDLTAEKYLGHTTSGAALMQDLPATIKASLISVSPGSFSNTCETANLSLSGSGNSNSYSHGHDAPRDTSWSSYVGDYTNVVPHANHQGANTHRVTDSTWNYRTLGGVNRFGHGHNTDRFTFTSGGSHSHTFNATANADHSHPDSAIAVDGTLDAAIEVELDSLSLVPIIYAGVKPE